MPDFSLSAVLTLLMSGLLAGVSNAIAGGGTFFTFPAFIAAGLSPVVANASNAVAVWPGHALAAIGYRRELSQLSNSLVGSAAIALTGGIIGALLLSQVGNAAFSKLIPFLILFATLLFALGHHLSKWLAQHISGAGLAHPNLITRLFELLFAIYGGFFGAGLGIMLMAGLLILGVHDAQTNNALKNLLATVITTVAVIILSISGLVSWLPTFIAFTGAVVGGLTGARLARLLPAQWLRRTIVIIGLGLSGYYFARYYEIDI